MFGICLFFIFLIVISDFMPSPESSLPPEDIAVHDLPGADWHDLPDNDRDDQPDTDRPLNPIISPRFIVDSSITERVPQMDAIQMMERMEAISDGKEGVEGRRKNAIVFMLQPGSTSQDFCDLLLSLTSAVSSTKPKSSLIHSSPSSDIDFLLFHGPRSFVPDALDLEAMAIKLQFKAIQSEAPNINDDDGLILEHIVRTLLTEEDEYDAMIYIDHREHSFVLQDLSILFGVAAVEKHHFGGIWSFHKTKEDRTEQCLLSTLFVVNLRHITNYNLDYESMFREQAFCGDEMRRANDEVIVIGDSAMSELERVSTKYGIMALPWWMVVDDIDFIRYFWASASVGHGLASWRRYSNEMEKQGHPRPISLIVHSRDENRMKSQLFWKHWLSIRQKPIDFCIDVSSSSRESG